MTTKTPAGFAAVHFAPIAFVWEAACGVEKEVVSATATPALVTCAACKKAMAAATAAFAAATKEA